MKPDHEDAVLDFIAVVLIALVVILGAHALSELLKLL